MKNTRNNNARIILMRSNTAVNFGSGYKTSNAHDTPSAMHMKPAKHMETKADHAKPSTINHSPLVAGSIAQSTNSQRVCALFESAWPASCNEGRLHIMNGIHETRTLYFAYMLRLWLAGQREGKPTWRASLENPHTGERLSFSNAAALFAFLAGIMAVQASDGGLSPPSHIAGSPEDVSEDTT